MGIDRNYFRLVFILILVLTLGFSCAQSPPKSGLLLWSKKIGGNLWAPLNHANGVLYFGSDNSKFYAFNLATQEVDWEFSTGDFVRSGSAISGNLVVFASDDGFLYALDKTSGEEKWRFDLNSGNIKRILPDPEPPYEYDYMHSSPVSDGENIIIGSADGNLYSIDSQTGLEIWRYSTRQKIRSTPLVTADAVIFGSWDGNLYAVDALTGKNIWRYDTGNIIQSSPVLCGDKIIIGSRSAKVFAVDHRTGEHIWTHTHEDGSWVESSGVCNDGVVYMGSSDRLMLFAFDAESGESKWEFKTGGWSWGTPVVENGVVYLGSISASPYYFEEVELQAGFYAVDKMTGNLIWQMAPGMIEGYITAGIFSKPVVVEGVIYVAGLDGVLYAYQE